MSSNPPTAITVALVGGTGLVGSACLDGLIGHPSVRQVITLGRRPSGRHCEKLREHLVTGFAEARLFSDTPLDVALCALGTTMAAAGSPQRFREVDHDAVLAFADNARRAGARRFVHVSSIGADTRSRNFYLRVKGEVEAALATLGFASLDILRPGLLLGDRDQPRPAESAARRLAPWANAALVGPLRKWRAIPAHLVARAMLAAAVRDEPGTRVLVYEDLLRLSRSLDARD